MFACPVRSWYAPMVGGTIARLPLHPWMPRSNGFEKSSCPGSRGTLPLRHAPIAQWPENPAGAEGMHERGSPVRFGRAARILVPSFLAILMSSPSPAMGGEAPVAQRGRLIRRKNRRQVPRHYQPISFAEILALRTFPAEYSEADALQVAATERRAVALEGYISEVIQARDGRTYGRPPKQGDLHVHLLPSPPPGCFSGRDRDRQIVTEVTPHFQPPRTGWSRDALVALCLRSARVRASGWLLHDYPGIRGVGDWRATAWEIHPVTKLEVWDEAIRAWRDLP